MLTAAIGVLLAAVVMGAGLAIAQLRTTGARRIPWPVGALHGLLGAGGIVLAVLAPAETGAAQAGAGGFRAIGVVLLCLALLAGLTILRRRLSGGPLTMTRIGIHALLAISGVVVLGAYLAVG